MDIAEMLKNLTSQTKSMMETPEETEKAEEEEPEKDKHPLDSFNDEEVVKQVEELQKSRRVLEQENHILTRFFQRNDPNAIEVMTAVIKTAEKAVQNAQARASTMDKRRSTASNSMRMSKKLSSIFSENTEWTLSSGMISTDRVGPRVNLTQRSDIVYREIDEIQNELTIFNKKAHKKKFILKSDLEELQLREADVGATAEAFDKLKQSFEGQNMPLFKYVRFMDECHRSSAIMCDKIRLRTSWYKIQYQKISNIYNQKLLIGENLQEVDFEQLRIENLHLMDNINQKNLLLLEMKAMNGTANLLLSQHKHALQKKIDTLNAIQTAKRQQEENLLKIDEIIKNENKDLKVVRTEFETLGEQTRKFRAPDVMDYVRKKAHLSQLKKEMNMWNRRKELKEVCLELSQKELTRLSKIKGIRPELLL